MAPSSAAPSQNRPVRCGVVGCGCRASRIIRTSSIERPLMFVGLYDPVDSAVKSTLELLEHDERVRVYETLEDICASDDIEALIITSPAHLHLKAVQLAVAAGKHILLEKPISNTIAEGREIMEILSGYEQVCYLGLQYRECPVLQKTRELIRLGRIGDVKMIQMQELRAPYLPKWNEWNKYSDMSGGTMVEKCCHFFDLFNLFAQSRPKRVFTSAACDVNYGDIALNGRPADVIDNAFTIVDFENGVRAALHLCMFSRQNFAGEAMTINGDGGTLYADFDGFYIHVGGNRQCDNIEEIHIRPRPAIRTSGHFGADYYQVRNFAAAIRDGYRDFATVEEGFWSLVVGVAAERSIQTGQPVSIQDVLKG